MRHELKRIRIAIHCCNEDMHTNFPRLRCRHAFVSRYRCALDLAPRLVEQPNSLFSSVHNGRTGKLPMFPGLCDLRTGTDGLVLSSVLMKG